LPSTPTIYTLSLHDALPISEDATALARVEVQPFGGRLERVRGFGPDGRRIPLAVRDGRLTPRMRLTPGEPVSVDVVVRRPGWLRSEEHTSELQSLRHLVCRL